MSKTSELIDLIRQYFSKAEVEDLCFRLGIDYDDLPGEGKANKVIHLVRYCRQHSRLAELIALCARLRPRLMWPPVAEVEAEDQLAPVPEGAPPGGVVHNYYIQGDAQMGDTFNMSGDFRGAILNIKSKLNNVTQTVGQIPYADASEKEQLQQLIEQLNQALQQAPADRVEEAEAVAKTAEVLIQTANEEKPNKMMVQITGEGLKKAAENIAGIMPTVLTIATQIVATISKIAGL